MRKPLVSTLLLGIALTVGAPAWGASAERASELMNQGVAHYSKGDLEAARQAFLEAFKLAPHHTIASNLAEVEIKLGKYREASEHLNYVLRSLPPSAAEERASSEKDLAECRERLSVVRVAVSVKGAAVTVDGETVGTAPLETELWLEPGEYVVEARHAGYQAASERVSVKAGESREIMLALGELMASEPGPTADDYRGDIKPSSGMSTKTAVVIGGSVLTLAAATVGTVFLFKRNAAADDADQALAKVIEEEPGLGQTGEACRLEPSERPKACATLLDARADEETFKNIALGSFIGAGAFGVATVVTYLVWPDKKSSAATPLGLPRSRVSFAPWIDRRARGVTAEFVLP